MRLTQVLVLLAITSCGSKPQQAPLSAVPPLQLAAGQELVAACGSSAGHSYYLAIGIPKEKSGWDEDGVAEGFFYVIKQPSGYDIKFRDTRGTLMSAVGDGAEVVKFRQGPKDIAFAVTYEDGGKTAEIYTLFREDDGTERFTNLVSKGGDGPIYKSGVMTGLCRGINVGA